MTPTDTIISKKKESSQPVEIQNYYNPHKEVTYSMFLSYIPFYLFQSVSRKPIVGGVWEVFCSLKGNRQPCMEFAQHNTDGRPIDHTFAVFGGVFIIFGESPKSGKPGKCSFNEPAFGKWYKSFL